MNYRDIGWIIYLILSSNKVEEDFIKLIIHFLKDKNIVIHKFSKKDFSFIIHDEVSKIEFFFISNYFFDIYFSNEIKNFEEIKNFIKLYNINEKDLKEAIEKYPIENNIEKYYGIAIQYNFVDTLMDNEEYYKFIVKKIKEKDLSSNNKEIDYLKKIREREREKQYYKYIKEYDDKKIGIIFEYALIKNRGHFRKTDNKLKKDLGEYKYSKFIDKIKKEYSLLNKYNKSYTYNKYNIYTYLFNVLSVEEIHSIINSEKNYEKFFWHIINYIEIKSENIFRIIDDKFNIFLEVIKEYIEPILIDDENCYDKSINCEGLKCNYFMDILEELNLSNHKQSWDNFYDYIQIKKKESPHQKNFFDKIDIMHSKFCTKDDLISLITKNNENSFYFFEILFNEYDINLALKYFYKYMYDSLSTKIIYSIELKFPIIYRNINHLFIRDINGLYVYYDIFNTRRVPLKNFCRDKNCSYNIIKIILFDKLLNLFIRNNKYQELKENYIKKILIDYYKFYKNEKIPLAKEYIDRSNFGDFFSNHTPIDKYGLIIEIWGFLKKNNKKYKNLLKELAKVEDKNIVYSAKYCMPFDNDYYKDILDKGLLPITSSSDLFEVVKEIWDKDIRNWIESEGAYKFINELAKKEQNTNAEDFIQKTIIKVIELGFSERGYEKRNYFIKREEQLLDDKRLDFTISYPPFGSIVIELKLAHNAEVQFKQNNEATKKAEEYISKLENDYIKGSNSDFALFVIFNIKEKKDKFDIQIKNLKKLYKNKDNIEVIGLNCVK